MDKTGLLITLYLVSKKLLFRPSLYLSAFFEANRPLYYDNLTRVRTKNDLTQWLKFFLVGAIQTAGSSVATFRQITMLKQRLETKIAGLGRKQSNAEKLLYHLFSQPVVTAQDVEAVLQSSAPTAHAILKDFSALGILQERTGYQRNRVFSFQEYIALFEE